MMSPLLSPTSTWNFRPELIENSSKEYNVRFMGEAMTAADFGKIRINNRTSGVNYRPQRISDVADIGGRNCRRQKTDAFPTVYPRSALES